MERASLLMRDSAMIELEQFNCPGALGMLIACIGTQGKCANCGRVLAGDVMAYCQNENCQWGEHFRMCLRCDSPLRNALLSWDLGALAAETACQQCGIK